MINLLAVLGSESYFTDGSYFTSQVDGPPNLMITPSKFDGDTRYRRPFCNSLTEHRLTVLDYVQDALSPKFAEDSWRYFHYRNMTLCPNVYAGFSFMSEEST